MRKVFNLGRCGFTVIRRSKGHSDNGYRVVFTKNSCFWEGGVSLGRLALFGSRQR